MISIRLKTIASFIEKSDKVADIGCDHAYLPIYLVKNKMCQNVLASDVNDNALENAKKNVKKEHLEKEIPCILSNGLEDICQEKIDTLILSGMGTSTILQILEKMNKDKIKKLILQSNNDLYKLRKNMKKMGYYLEQEKVIFENKHYYCIGLYTKKKRKYKKVELYFGLYAKENKFYYQDLFWKLTKIKAKVNWKHGKAKVNLLYSLHVLKKYL